MKNLSLFIILILLQFSCGLKTYNPELINEKNIQELEELKNIITKNNLPDLIVKIEQNQKQAYLLAIENSIDQISRLWDTESQKISITAYLKPKDLTGIITAYNYNNSDIVKSDLIPEKILNAFNEDFKCPKPEENSPIKRSTTLAFDKNEADLRIRIEEFK